MKEKFYINAENTFTKISKDDYSLNSTILYAMRKVNPNIFPDLNFE